MSTERIALLLPGQGSQYVGMGQDLATRYAAAAAVYEEANDILGCDLRRICWEGPKDELTRTQNAQPAILLHSYAVWRCLPDSVRDRARVAAGHSLGEFSAYLAAGTLCFADALRLVRRRGELMAMVGSARPGTMAAIIGLEVEAVLRVCAEESSGIVVPANYNAPGQVVISGDVAAVDAARERTLEAGAKRAIPLNVSGAFHSPLMADARDGLAAALADVDLRVPAFPVVANASALPVTEVADAREQLIQQLTSPVRWVECVETMRAQNPVLWLEIGPGNVLSGLMRRIDRDQNTRAIRDPEDLESFQEFLQEDESA